MVINFSKYKYLDLPLFFTTLLLITVGFAMQYGISFSEGNTQTFWRQIIFLGLGIATFFFFTAFDYHQLTKNNRAFYLIFLALLFYILFLGPEIRGGRRSISLGFVHIQLAEFVKISLILGLSRLLYKKRGQINSPKTLIWSFFYMLLPAGLTILEPDFGSAFVMFAIWAGLILTSPIKKRLVVLLGLLFLILSLVSWQFLLKDFQKDRIRVFLNPKIDPLGKGYNVKQATIAIGSGKFFGWGLGKGLQSQNKFLPEKQTDFIFAATAEEIGFLGTSLLLFLYFFLLYRLVKIARKARDDLGMYISFGIFFFIFTHVVINIGMNLGIMPVTGIPLPLLSAGGSAVIATLISLGIAQNICLQTKILRF